LTCEFLLEIITGAKPPEERQEETMKWESFYQAAVLETDWSKLEERIEATDFAIAERLQEFSANHGGNPEENRQIQDALAGLIVRLWRGDRRLRRSSA
jgi:hypothetical protein